ncbi:S-layer homology domain-containing protein [Paenibacillus sp. N3.4]|uniref:S-layer homology domain-containing protein n=1 Tax=Paenibacillus sp. N3.4 TaxID=2603222 RepID=UPI0011CC67EB|nr:S-layer homology domain-containing protein [Paenibacillus sp. N3.4]TXK80372.1 S-layer homology domain-containing protein [Paenibacillus sp. N3.4]
MNKMKVRNEKVKFRKLSLMLILTLCLLLVPVAGFASSTAVTLSAIASIQPGGTVLISGTSTLNEVIIQVLRPTNGTVFYGISKVNDGKFASSFTLANSEVVGTYKVIAGQADQVASTDLVVKAANPGPGPGPGPGGVSGPIGTISAPGKPITPAKSKAEPAKVDTSRNVAVSTKSADGHVTTTVTQDATALADALAKVAKQDNRGDAPIVFISFNNPAGESVQFNIPSSVLAAAALSAPNTIISLQTNDGEYSLPLGVIDFAAIAQSLGTSNDNTNIQVNISFATTDINNKIKKSAVDMGASQQGSAIEFSVTAVGNGKTVELNNFGSTYVDRNVVLATPVDETHATVVLYDVSTGQFSFVPAVFEKQADGSTKVTIKRNGNSIYTVLSSTKTFNDVSQHWAKADIELLASKLVVKGATDSSFAPESNITRAEFAALLVRSLGLMPDAGSSDFTDVKSTDWFAGAIGTAVKAKLVDGFKDSTFKPNDTITREQMAVMVSRAITAAGKTSNVSDKLVDRLAKFQDQASISSWAQSAVAQSVEAKIITGMTDQTFVPSANASRAQAVVMLKRFMQFANFIN